MPGRLVLKVYRDIKNLKIQSASNVRKAVVKTLFLTAKNSKAKTRNAFEKEMHDASELLLSARPTEPEARNAANIVLRNLKKAGSVEEARKSVVDECRKFELNRKKALEKIAEKGAEVIKKKSIVFTHCHSHTVESIFIKAKKNIKKVIATETRPLFQGHLTVKALTGAGLDCRLIVDSAASTFMKEADAVFVGADAITAKGELINKIGTRTMSLIARELNKPFYVCSSSLKFDPLTVFGYEEVIEQRPVNEVWNRKLKRLKVVNPAFDITPVKNVKGIISELGVLKPGKFISIMSRKARKEK